jgi:hypothetical protein
MFSEVASELKLINRAIPAPTYVFPGVYPANHPSAGNAHPNAGEPDTLTLVKALSAHLRLMIEQGLIRVKADQVHEVEDDDDADVFAFRNARKIDKMRGKNLAGKDKAGKPVELTDKSRCFRCGGLGHYAVTNGQKCPTSIKIGREILDAITYPHIKNERPVPKDLTVNEVSESDDDEGDDEEVGMIDCDEDFSDGTVDVPPEDVFEAESDDLDDEPTEDELMHDFGH